MTMISSTNPKFFKEISQATSSLINSVTDFAEGSENHEICKEYALSHFGNSRFMDTDSHKTERRIKGLCEKFVIHNQPEKAEILENWRKKYLNSDLTDTSQAGSHIHYDLLFLMLELSENPVNKEYHLPPERLEEEKEEFDWKAYLLEGEDLPYPSQWSFPDTPYGSDDEGVTVDDRNAKKEPSFHSDTREKLPETQSASCNFKSAGHLVPQYWLTKASQGTDDNWLKFHADTGTLNIPKTSDLSEVHIVREVLWALSGCTDLFIFPCIEGKHTVHSEVLVTHATSKSFCSALSSIANSADIVSKVSNFIFQAGSLQNQTYQAFAESLLSYKQLLLSELKEIEAKILRREETLLLSDVLSNLSPKLNELEIINSLFIKSIDCDKKGDTSCQKSCRLLGALYFCIVDETSKDMISISTFQNMLIKMWVDTLRPYFNILDSWMSSGTLNDRFNEFILSKSNTCTDVKTESFWSEGFSLADEECMKCLPWLKPVLNDVIICGKSVELLKSLGKPIKEFTDTSLHEGFVKAIAVLPDDDENKFSAISSQTAELDGGHCDVILRLNFERLFSSTREPSKVGTFRLSGKSSFVDLVHRTISELIKTKHNIVNEALLDVFMVDQNLPSALQCFHKFHLMGWGDVMYDFTTSVFEKMSNNEYWMDLMSLRASLQEAIFSRDSDDSYAYLSVALNKEKEIRSGLANQPINATDIMEIIFEVEWPLNIIITEKSKTVYNRIFAYIMQIKRALFCLERLKFGEIYTTHGDSQAAVAHRLSLLRSSLLCLTSHWHNFVMTSVIEAEKNAFMESLKSVRNVDEIIVLHEKFLNRILSLCLLNEETQSEKLIQGTLRKIFDLALSVHSKWKRIHTVSLHSLKRLESDYKECSEFLGVILLNLVSRGSVPLSLEALAFCLRT